MADQTEGSEERGSLSNDDLHVICRHLFRAIYAIGRQVHWPDRKIADETTEDLIAAASTPMSLVRARRSLSSIVYIQPA